jgi:hypothetical protein
LARIIFAGLNKNGKGEKPVLFYEKLIGKMSDYYIYAHFGKYERRFWRTGIYEILFDYQIRANEIGNDIARVLNGRQKCFSKLQKIASFCKISGQICKMAML